MLFILCVITKLGHACVSYGQTRVTLSISDGSFGPLSILHCRMFTVYLGNTVSHCPIMSLRDMILLFLFDIVFK